MRPPGSELRVKRAKRHVDGSDARRTRKCDGAGGLGNDQRYVDGLSQPLPSTCTLDAL